VHRAQVCIAEDINHEVFCFLLESQNSWALHLQVALSKFQCNLAYKMLEGGFPDEEICMFLELLDPLEAPFLGASGEAFSWQSPFARPLVQTLWLNESVGLLPQ
jgi:hypothetical protein